MSDSHLVVIGFVSGLMGAAAVHAVDYVYRNRAQLRLRVERAQKRVNARYKTFKSRLPWERRRVARIVAEIEQQAATQAPLPPEEIARRAAGELAFRNGLISSAALAPVSTPSENS